MVTSLSTEQRNQLIARSDVAGLRHLLGHVLAIGACTALIVSRVPGWPAVMVVQGILLNFLFTTLHETVHRTPFKTRWLNDAVGGVCAFVVVLGPRHFRHFHLAHHRYTNDPGNDPELSSPRPATPVRYAMYMSGLSDWSWRVRTLVKNAISPNRDPYVPERARSAVRREARVFIGLYLGLAAMSVALVTNLLVVLWVAPLLVGGPFLRGYLLAEHAGCPSVESMFDNTRTTFTNRAVRFISWNMPFHAEHHVFPAVPFHQLPAFHEHTKQHLGCTADGYLAFNRNYLRGDEPLS